MNEDMCATKKKCELAQTKVIQPSLFLYQMILTYRISVFPMFLCNIEPPVRRPSASVICGEVSAAPLAVRWGHVRLPGRSSTPPLGRQHPGAAGCYRYGRVVTAHLPRLWRDSSVTPRFEPLLCFFSSSQPTPTPAGLHQPVRRQAAGKAHLRGKGGAAVHPGGDRHARDWYVLASPLPVWSNQIET